MWARGPPGWLYTPGAICQPGLMAERPVHKVGIAPGLLLSMPQLVDPNFHRAVVLMVEHNDEGSFGLILNKPSEMSVRELLEALELEWAGDGELVVGSGGPVMPTTGWVLHQPSAAVGPGAPSLAEGLEHAGTVSITPEVDLSTSPAKLRKIAEAPPGRIRFLLGYAGWGPGQLAAEMASGSWLHADVDPALVFDTPTDEMWATALRTLGVDASSVVQGRGVH
jgi:putative transcriptional regulator